MDRAQITPRSSGFLTISFFLGTPAIAALYAAFMRYQAPPFDQGSLAHSILFAFAFTLPGWWLAWGTTFALVRLSGDRLSRLLVLVAGYIVSLVVFRPYYAAVYELIATAQPWTASLVASRRYGLDWASVETFARVNAPGLVIWLLAHSLYGRLLGYDPYARSHGAARRADAPVGADNRVAQVPCDLPSFAQGLGAASAREIERIEAEEHYLRIVFAGGRSALVRCRMRDAVAELPADLGLRVHRSYWVARSVIHHAEPAGKSLTLVLRDGTRIPVSLGYREAVRQAQLAPTVLSVTSRPDAVVTAH